MICIKPKMLLLVEDDALVAMATEMQLESYRYCITTARTGEEAVEVCRTNSAIDLILMDVDLGAGMSGTEAAVQILKTRQLPVVFHSSRSIQEIKVQAEQIPSYGYVVKGSSLAALDASIIMTFSLFKANQCYADTECLAGWSKEVPLHHQTLQYV